MTSRLTFILSGGVLLLLCTWVFCQDRDWASDPYWSGYQTLMADSKVGTHDGWCWLFVPDPAVVGRGCGYELRNLVEKPDSAVVEVLLGHAQERPRKSSGFWNVSVILTGENAVFAPDCNSSFLSLFIVLPSVLPPSGHDTWSLPVFVLLPKDDSSAFARAWRSWAEKHNAKVDYINANHGRLPDHWGEWLESAIAAQQSSVGSGWTQGERGEPPKKQDAPR